MSKKTKYRIKNWSSYNKYFSGIAFGFFGVLYLLSDVQVYILSDSSFQTKINIFENLFSRVDDIDLRTILFGGGYEKGGFLYSPNPAAYAHALIPLLLGQVGVIGCACYVATLAYVATRWHDARYWIVAFVLTGFSLSDPFEPYYFLPMVIYVRFRNSEKRTMMDAFTSCASEVRIHGRVDSPKQ